MFTAKPIKCEETFTFPASCAEAWLALAHTDHFNRRSGLQTIKELDRDDSGGAIVSRRHGLWQLRWYEHPYEWQEGSQLSVVREYENGPLKKYWGGVELLPGEGEKEARIHVFAYLLPRSWMSYCLLRLCATAIFHRYVRFSKKILKEATSAFQTPMRSPGQTVPAHFRIKQKMGTLRSRTPVNATHWDLLEAHIRQAPDLDVRQMRPAALAARWGQAGEDILKMFIHAAADQLLKLDWAVLCEDCRTVQDLKNHIKNVPAEFACKDCGLEQSTHLDRHVELRFSVNPIMRAASDARYSYANPFLRENTLAKVHIAPGDERLLSLPMEPQSTYRLRALRANTCYELSPGERSNGVRIVCDGQSFRTKPAKDNVTICNESERPLVIVVEELPQVDTLTNGLAVSTMPAFTQSFPGQLLATQSSLPVHSLVLMQVRLTDHERLCTRLGDEKTFALTGAYLGYVMRQVSPLGATVIKQHAGHAWLRYPDLSTALRGVLDLRRDFADFQTSGPDRESLQQEIAFVADRCLAVNNRGKPDYFGHLYHRLQASIDASSAVASVIPEDCTDLQGVSDLLNQYGQRLQQDKTNHHLIVSPAAKAACKRLAS